MQEPALDVKENPSHLFVYKYWCYYVTILIPLALTNIKTESSLSWTGGSSSYYENINFNSWRHFTGIWLLSVIFITIIIIIVIIIVINIIIMLFYLAML